MMDQFYDVALAVHYYLHLVSFDSSNVRFFLLELPIIVIIIAIVVVLVITVVAGVGISYNIALFPL